MEDAFEREALALLQKHHTLVGECFRVATTEYGGEFVVVVCPGTAPPKLIAQAAVHGTVGSDVIAVVRPESMLGLLQIIGCTRAQAEQFSKPMPDRFHVVVLARNGMFAATRKRPRSAFA